MFAESIFHLKVSAYTHMCSQLFFLWVNLSELQAGGKESVSAVEVCLILHEQDGKWQTLLDLTRALNTYRMFPLKMSRMFCLIRDERRLHELADAWNKLGTFPKRLNCPCQNSSGIPFFNIQCSAGAGYKSSLICFVERQKKKKGNRGESSSSFHRVTVKCDHQIVSRLMREIEDFSASDE